MDDFFTYIDFGKKANKFLKDCGVKKRPSSIDIARLLVKSSHQIWDSIGDYKIYLTILDIIANNYSDIVVKQPDLITQMKSKPILAGIKFQEAICHLASTKEIFINDDTGYQQIFDDFLTTPINEINDSLKDLYKVCATYFYPYSS